MASSTSQNFDNVNIKTSILIPEANNAADSTTSETKSSGIFVTPSTITSRPSIIGYSLTAVNELGKLQFTDVSGSSSESLGDLTDVTLTSPSDGNALVYNGLEWVDGVPDILLAEITDVVLTTPSSGDALIFDGVEWINGLPVLTVEDLSDVTLTNPTNGEILIFNGSEWVNGPSSTSVSLEDLTDVVIETPLAGDALVFDGADWVNGVPSIPVNDLSDVTLTAPATGDALVFDGADWINGTPSITVNELSNVTAGSPQQAEALLFDGSGWVNGAPSVLPHANVTQVGGIASAVTLNSQAGFITTDTANANINGGTNEFTFNNSFIVDLNSVILITVSEYSGVGNPVVYISSISVGSCVIRIVNVGTSGILNSTFRINFVVH